MAGRFRPLLLRRPADSGEVKIPSKFNEHHLSEPKIHENPLSSLSAIALARIGPQIKNRATDYYTLNKAISTNYAHYCRAPESLSFLHPRAHTHSASQPTEAAHEKYVA